MEWFEKIYKKRFEDESSLEGVDANLLWSQIAENIPQKKATFSYWKWSLMGIILIGTVATWIFIQNENSTNDLFSEDSNTTIQSIENLPENNIYNNIENKEIIANPKVNNKGNVNQVSKENNHDNTNNSTIRDDIKSDNLQNLTSAEEDKGINDARENQELTRNINDSKSSDRKEISADNKSKSNPLQNQILNSNTNSEKSINTDLESNLFQNTKPSLFQNTQHLNKNDDSIEKSIVEEDKIISSLDEVILNTAKSRGLVEIEKLDLPLIADLKNQNTIDIDVAPVSPPIKIAQTKNPFAINVKTSVNFFDLNYSDDQNPELFAGEANESLGSLQIGNSFALNIEYQLNHSWSIGTGLELNNYENKLDKIITSDTTKFDGQKVRRAKYIRTVKHHNKLSTYTIPLSLSYENRMSDRWSVGASIGASYSLIKSQRGKILSRNNVILEYSDLGNSQFNNFLSLRINPFLRYGISNKVSISINAGLSVQNHGRAEAQDLKQSSKIYNIGLGLNYKM